MTYSHLLRFSRQMERYYAERFVPMVERTGLTMNEIHELLFLANNPDCDTARDVVMLRGLSKSQVSQAVEAMVNKGVLLRRADDEDRRVVHLAITEAGVSLAKEAQSIQADCGAQLLDGITAEELAVLRRAVEQMMANGNRLMGKESVQ